MIRVVTRGQYFHQGIRELLLEEMVHRPQAMLTGVISRLIELGPVEDYPSAFLAVELQAVMVANFCSLSLHIDRLWVDLPATRRAMEMHVDFFWRAAGKTGQTQTMRKEKPDGS